MILYPTRHAWARMCRALAHSSSEARGLSITAVAIALTLIAVGGDALRGPTGEGKVPDMRLTAPRAADRLTVTMAAPVGGGWIPMVAHDRADGGPGRADTGVPRLAALAPPEGEGADTRVSRLSRIFRGPPPVVPPVRPSTGARAAAQDPDETGTRRPSATPRPRARPATQDVQAAALQADTIANPQRLRPRARPYAQPDAQPVQAAAVQPDTALPRPRARPDNLGITSAIMAALRFDPTDADPLLTRAPAAPTRPQAALPAAPQIVRASGRCPARLTGEIPRRARNAAGASVVLADLRGVDGVTRDRHVTREILAGNIPGFLRNLQPVGIRGLAANGTPVVITLCVTPDYLALGSDADHVRIPLGLRAATRLGDAFNMVLPTPRMVDLIHRGAAVRLSPRPMPAGPQMTSTDYLVQHNTTIDGQRNRARAASGTLISGHKKDVVLTTRLATMPGRVAIYGWHRDNGQPIQPLSTVHGAGYSDYSHGVRLVSRTAFLDAKPVDLRSLMASPLYAGLLSDEGPVTGPRLHMAALAAN